MKKKLTITVDDELIPRAKQYAKSQGVSLSALIESAMRDMVPGEEQSFSSKWRGKFKPANHDGPRYEAFARKYL
jgi:post-segregation antitoxin (ccd killing protein)